MEEYSDTRLMSKEFLRGFIDIYRSNIALWKVNSKEYSNKLLKEIGYGELVAYSQEKFPSADKEFVRKRVQNMRGCFRKEYKKVIDNQKKGEVHEPKLWYYELLLFIKDGQNDDLEGISLDNEDCSIKCENAMSDEEFIEEGSENAETASSLINAPILTQISNQNPEQRKRRLPIQEEREMKRPLIYPSQNGLIQDEFEAVGVNVAAKLRRMDSTQQILAESLISKVILRGMFGELTRNTDVWESIPHMSSSTDAV